MDISLEEVTCLGDEDLLSQVWMNLLYNSIKFTPQGKKINISLDCRDGQVQFMIRDSGIGISPEDLGRIFERFYKADPSRTASAGGSGLGLSIAKKIVEMHQGTIEVESQVGAGALFKVILPLKS
jgi:signal transduction histidine kinase